MRKELTAVRQEKVELKREKDRTIQRLEEDIHEMRNKKRQLIDELEGYDAKIAEQKASHLKEVTQIYD